MTVNLAQDTASHVSGQVLDILNVISGAGNDTLIGNNEGNTLLGGAGKNTILNFKLPKTSGRREPHGARLARWEGEPSGVSRRV